MNLNNMDRLIEDYPNLYGSQFYFECGDGWFEIIKDLSEKLSKLKGIKALQVKEKFGGLRFYFQAAYKSQDLIEAENLIREAEERAMKTCEVCGFEGKLRTDIGWIRVLCDTHHKEVLAKKLA